MKSPVEICSDERELKNGGDWSGCTSETGEILLLISLCLHFKPIAAIPTGFNGKSKERKGNPTAGLSFERTDEIGTNKRE